MSGLVENVGSAARDWCMLERNMLSHLRLSLLLSLLSAAILFDALAKSTSPLTLDNLYLVFVLMGSAIIIFLSGLYEYRIGDRSLKGRHTFLSGSLTQLVALTTVVGVILSAYFIFLVDSN